MLKTLALKNFQAHKDSIFDLHPGVNVIAGKSDAGKSAVVRGSSWLFSNRPQGFAFKRNTSGEKDVTSVRAVFDGGEEVTRQRSAKGVNEYSFPEESFKALRTDVPEEVREVFNMGECNIQSQHAPYFLLLDTPGEVARKLNSLVGAEDIGGVLSKINRKIAQHASERKSATDESLRLQEEIDKFPDLGKLEKMALKAINTEGLLDACILEQEAIGDILYLVRESLKDMKAIPDFASAQISLEGLQEDASHLLAMKAEQNALRPLVRLIQEHEKELKGAQAFLQAVVPKMEGLESDMQRVLDARNKASDIAPFIESTHAYKRLLKKANTSLLELSMDLRDLVAENPICPTCGGNMAGAL